MSGCRHPYLLPGKHVKHVAFDHPHAVWFLQMASPAKKLDSAGQSTLLMVKSRHGLDGEFPLTTSQNTGVRTGVIPSGNLT